MITKITFLPISHNIRTLLIDMYDASCEDSTTAQSNSINPIQDTTQLNSSHQSLIKEVESCEKHDTDRAQKKIRHVDMSG